jgi:hypothetical protein
MLTLLFIYFILLIIFIIFSVAAIYHLNRFGYVGDLTRPVIAIYIVLSAIVIAVTFVLIATRSWPSDFSL